MTPETCYADNELLLRRAQEGDERAKEELIQNNLGLVHSIAKRFYRDSEEEDLFQIGCIGLLKAVERFEESFGVKFSTYAVPLILGEIKRFLRDDGAVKVSRRLKEVAGRARREIEHELKTTGKEPGIAELSQRLGVERDELILSLSSALPVGSFSDPISPDDESYTLENTLAAEDGAAGLIDRLALREVLCFLPEEERKLIYLRFFKEITQSETAKILKTSQVQVSRMEKKILARLRELLSRTG